MTILSAEPTSEEKSREITALAAVRDGDYEAFADIVREYQRRLYNYLYRFAHNKEDCEDLVSDTFYQAFTQLKSCRDLGKFKAWIYRIAHNLGVNFWRKQKRERTWTTKLEDLAFEVASWAHSQEEESRRREEGRLVEAALKELPEHYRSALFLFYHEDFSYHETAQILGIPLSSVKTHLFRGRKMLEDKLRQSVILEHETQPLTAVRASG